jgi:hypothetical protein
MNPLGSRGRRLLEAGRRLQRGDGDLLAVAPPSHDLDQASPQDEERRAGLPLLDNAFAVSVVALMDDAGETPELPEAQVFEEGDLLEEVRQAAMSVGGRRFRRRSEERSC